MYIAIENVHCFFLCLQLLIKIEQKARENKIFYA